MNIYTTSIFLAAHKDLQMYGVYLLFNDDVVVYVGSTGYPSSRIYSHNRSDKDFNRVGWISCERESMPEIEASKIVEYNPEYNSTLPTCGDLTTINQCLLESKSTINNMIKELPVVFQRANRSYVKISEFNRIMEVMEIAARKELSIINSEFMKKEFKS